MANIYHVLLASQGDFPIPSVELKLIKKAWKFVNVESGVKPLTLTPSIVTIVSISFNINLSYYYIHSSRLKLEARIGCNMGVGKTVVLQSWVTWVQVQVLIFRPEATPHP